MKSYLTYLAVNCKVSSSTQNLAFNALLFLYRHILKRDFGDHKDIPRAKKSTYVPVVLSRDEIQEVLARLIHPYQLIAKLQYGCGLRCFEAVKVRVKDFNFDTGLLTIKGKGGKSRTVPMPNRIVPELLAQLAFVKKLHADDLAAGYAGVFLEDQLEKKYPNAAREFQWQWFFPAGIIDGHCSHQRKSGGTTCMTRGFRMRCTIAVKRAQLTKRVTTHTLRHSFATHLLQANYDIRTIQDTARPCRCPDDDDLYSLRSEQDREGSEKSFGFLNWRHDTKQLNRRCEEREEIRAKFCRSGILG